MSETRDLVSGLNPVDQWARVPQPSLPQPNLQAPTAAAPTAPPPANPSAQVADFYSKEFNLPPYVGAGIAEYMKTRESGLDPLAYNPNDHGSPSAGIAQWRGDRLEQLSRQPNATTLEGQLQFSAQELRGSEKGTLDALKKARNQQEAFDIWKTSYERPAEFQMGHGWATEDRSRYQDQHDSSMGMAREYMRLANEELPGSKERAQLLMQARDEAHKATEAFNRLSQSPPIYKPNDIAENFGSVAVLLSVLGGMFAKRPFTASLAAAGQAMQAQNQQNYDQFKIANEQWHTQAQLGLDQVKLAHDEIKEVLDDERLEFNEKQARLQSILQGYQMGEQARWHDIEYQHMLNQDRLANYTRGVETVQRQQTLNLFNEMQAARALSDDDPTKPQKIKEAEDRMSDWNKSQGKGLNIFGKPQIFTDPTNNQQYTMIPGQPGTAQTLTGESYEPGGAVKLGTGGQGRWSEDAMNALVQQGLRGDPSVMTSLPRSGPARQQYEEALAAALKANPGGITGGTTQMMMNRLRMAEAKSAAQTAGRITMNTALYSQEAQGAGQLVIEASKKFPRTEIPQFNQALQAYERGTGDPNIIAFGTAINALVNAYGKMTNPTGTGIHDADKESLRQIIDTSLAEGQIEAGVAQIIKEGVNVSSAAQQAQVEVMSGLVPRNTGEPQFSQTPSPPSIGTAGGTIRYDAQGNRVP